MKNTSPTPPHHDNTAKPGKRAGWFIVLWLSGVLGAILIASFFKVLMLGAVKL